MDGMIRAHCMGTVFPTFEEQASYRKLIEDAALLWRDMAKTEFPKRDTDSPKVEWVPAAKLYADRIVNDLSVYTERIKEKTSAKVPNR